MNGNSNNQSQGRSNNSNGQTVPGGSRRRNGRGSRRGNGRNPAGGPRGMRARNPARRTKPDNMLSLTRDQFTATSPLNLFAVGPGSTPGGVRVKGRELISAVSIPAQTGAYTLSTGFTGSATVNNAGWVNPINFPRLAAYTPIYEYFVFHKISYLFQSNQPTTQPGEIILSVDYDPTDPPAANTADQMRNISATMANVYSDCSLQVLKDLNRLPRYECSAAPAEILQQVQAKLQVAVEGLPTTAAATTVGYIIAQYDIEFFTPQ